MKKLLFFTALLIALLTTNTVEASTQIILGANRGNSDDTLTTYAPLQGAWDGDNTESSNTQVFPANGTLKNLRVKTEDVPGSGNSYTITIRTGMTIAGMADSDVTCAVSDTSDTCSDVVNTLTISAGDLVNMEIVPTSLPTESEIGWAVEFIPTTSGQTVLMGGADSMNATRYISLAGWVTVTDSTEDDASALIPVTGNFTAVYAFMPTGPGSGTSWTWTIRDSTGAADASFSCTISDTDTTCNGSGTDAVGTAGDSFAMKVAESGTTTASLSTFGVVFEPTDDEDSIIITQTSDTASSSSVESTYLQGSQNGSTWTSASFGERFTSISGISSASNYITDAYWRTSAAPGSGTSITYTINLYDASSPMDTDIAVTYSDAETGLKSLTGQTVTIANEEGVRWRTTPVSSPTTGETKFGLVLNIPEVVSGDRRVILFMEH